jgi:cellulose synthase/poly-beta-1,6-N-acetylglucosamine synthase-like glycosyltransferase
MRDTLMAERKPQAMKAAAAQAQLSPLDFRGARSMPLDLFSGLVFPAVQIEASEAARKAGTSVLDALMARTDVPVSALVRRLSHRSSIEMLDWSSIDASAEELSAASAANALRSGVLRLRDGRMIVATRGEPLSRVIPMLRRSQGRFSSKFSFASPREFAGLVMQLGGQALAQEAARSASRLGSRSSAQHTGLLRYAAPAILGILALTSASGITALMVHMVLTMFFLALAFLRLFAYVSASREPEPTGNPFTDMPRIPDHALPVYTILVPLYREARVIEGLLKALHGFDYPAAKLDIKILVEEDDAPTREALARLETSGNVEILALPQGLPRTKPRALNVGLAAARGSLVAVFDAEDKPDAGQLRAAVQAFRQGGETLVCVQARLCIDNTFDGWLTRHFTLEYAALFDVLLPALARLRTVFPLGGTSNHFRTRILREMGGWDAHNVTEDADLGARLGRMGYSIDVINSTTWEEAPNRFKSWLFQRTRWVKGYMMTWYVHMRAPVQLYRQLGMKNFFIFQGLIGGVPVVALALPVFIISALVQISTGIWLQPSGLSVEQSVLLGFQTASLVLGFTAATLISRAAIRQRGLGSLGLMLWTLPLYWLYGSVAAWRALFQLAWSPHVWEKTEHGNALTSRQNADAVITAQAAGGQ